jgi:uroporphyrinogen decarboxylase
MERVQVALRGEAVDRPPYSFWTHFPGIDLDPEALARETIAFARELDLDFVKSMPNGQFCTEDWGTVSDFSEIARGGVARAVKRAVDKPEGWKEIRRLDVSRGAFGRELEHLSMLCDALGKDTPVLATVFSPLTVALKLAGEGYRTHLKSHPERIEPALSNIAATMASYVQAALQVGCAGVFFASQEGSFRCMSQETFLRFGKPFDLEVLKAATAGWFNVIHMHGEDVMFDVLRDYPVTALNWHIGETSPLLADYAAKPLRKPVVGGLRRMALTRGDLAMSRTDIASAMAATSGRGLLLGPACVIRYPVDRAALKSVTNEIRRAARETGNIQNLP